MTPTLWTAELSGIYEMSKSLAVCMQEALKRLEHTGEAPAAELIEMIQRYQSELDHEAHNTWSGLPEDLCKEAHVESPITLKSLSHLKALSRRGRCRELLQRASLTIEEILTCVVPRSMKSFEDVRKIGREWLENAEALTKVGDLEAAAQHLESAQPFEDLLSLILSDDEGGDGYAELCKRVSQTFGVVLLTQLHLIREDVNEVGRLSAEIEELRQKLSHTQRELSEANDMNEMLWREYNELDALLTELKDEKAEVGIEPKHHQIKVTPEHCLSKLVQQFPDRVVVLESAYKSARVVRHFMRTDELWGLLYKLATEYVDLMSTDGGGGDIIARDRIFGESNFSPSESEQTSRNGRAQKSRCFVYNGKSYLMLRHLKLGKLNNTSYSIRVHFEWIPEEQRVVIGHCGAHLYLKDFC